jgi:hypothetical protein
MARHRNQLTPAQIEMLGEEAPTLSGHTAGGFSYDPESALLRESRGYARENHSVRCSVTLRYPMALTALAVGKTTAM